MCLHFRTPPPPHYYARLQSRVFQDSVFCPIPWPHTTYIYQPFALKGGCSCHHLAVCYSLCSGFPSTGEALAVPVFAIQTPVLPRLPCRSQCSWTYKSLRVPCCKDLRVRELPSPDVPTVTSLPRTYEHAAAYGYDSHADLIRATSGHHYDQSSSPQSKCESLPAMTVPPSSSQMTLAPDITHVQRYCVHYQWPNNHTHH